jgi:Malonate/sodium symporter MadM subunit
VDRRNKRGPTNYGGGKRAADHPLAIFRDFAIVATAFGVGLRALRKAGLVGTRSIVIGVVPSFVVGAVIAVLFGYSDSVATPIGAGAAPCIVGPSPERRRTPAVT